MILPNIPVQPPNIGPSCTPAGNADHRHVELDEAQLFVGIVQQLQLPVPVRQLPRHLQRRLEIFFKFALPVPPCNSCGDASGVRFRYFNNANKSSILQPRYQCFCCCSCTTTAANPRSTCSTLFTLNQKKYAAHLQLHGGIHTILQNNRIILNNCSTSENDACQGTTNKLLPVRRHKTSPPMLRAPAAAATQQPARFQSPPTMNSYGFNNFGDYDWRATATVLPNTEMYSIDEGAGTCDNFSSGCQELRQENTSLTGGAFAELIPAGNQQLLYSMGNASHLNLINRSAVQSSSLPYYVSFKAQELDEALKVVESGLELEDICIMNGAELNIDQPDLQSIELPDLDSFDLPDLETLDLPDLAEATNDLPDLQTLDLPDLGEATNDLPDVADSIFDLPADLADLPDLTESIDLPDIADSVDLPDIADSIMDSPALDFDKIYFNFEAGLF